MFDVLISIISDDVPDFVGTFREKCVKRNVKYTLSSVYDVVADYIISREKVKSV